MFARLTYIDIQPEHHDELRRIYNDEVIPVVRKQKGNIGIWLMEPTDLLSTEYISLTEWSSAEDAGSYDSSGTYRGLVDKLKSLYKNKPVLKAYHVVETKLATTL